MLRVGAIASAGAAAAWASGEDRAPGLVVTEVLFNVPREGGDANGDGERNATGDEFVELFNPTTATIDLAGYMICNRLTFDDAKTSRGVRFVFPSVDLPPGGVAVAFNGHGWDPEGPVGTAARAPSEGHPSFHGALVFTMELSRMRAFRNTGDFLVVVAPDGTPIEVVAWGKSDEDPPRGGRMSEVDDDPEGSVQRPRGDRPFASHVELDGRTSSPGEVPG